MRWLIVLVLSLLAVRGADAQSAPNLPPLQQICDNPWGHFSHYSSIEENDDHSINGDWIVCNLDPNNVPLIFSWDAPRINTGDDGRLPANVCASVSVPVLAPEPDNDASILYTQGSRSCPAPAYVPKLPSYIPENVLPHFLKNLVRTFLHGGAQQPNFVPLELKLEQRREGNFVFHTISWNPPSVTVAIAADYFQGLPPDKLASETKYPAIYEASLGKVLNDKSGLSVERLETPVVVIAGNHGEPLTFETAASVNTIAMKHLTLIDTKTKSMIMDVQISSFAASER